MQPLNNNSPVKKQRTVKGCLKQVGIVAIVLLVILVGITVLAVTTTPTPQTSHKPVGTVPAQTKTVAPSPSPTMRTMVTADEKRQVHDILQKSIQHYQDLLTQGKQVLGTTQYPDGQSGLTAMQDPTSAAAKFAAWRQSSNAERDMSFMEAFKQADAFYTANNEPDAISAWRNDMSNVQANLDHWITVAAGWQISTRSTADLQAAEAQVQSDLQQSKIDATATVA